MPENSEEARDETRISLRSFFLCGLLAGAIANILLYIGAEFLGFPYPPEAIFQVLIAPVPGSIQSVIVDTFREYAKYGLFTFTAIAYTLLYGFVALATGYLSRGRYLAGRFPFLIIAIAGPTAVGLGLQATLASRVSTLNSVAGWLVASLLMVTVNVAYAGILVDLTRDRMRGMLSLLPRRMLPKATASGSRRSFLRKVIIAAAVLVVAGIAAQIGSSLFFGRPIVRSNTPIPIDNSLNPVDLSDAAAIFSDPRISDLVGSEVTDNRIFYRVDINPIQPQLSFDQWSMRVFGKVNTPLTIDKGALLSLASRDQYATLECVSNTIDPPGALISNAKWTGVPLADLLNKAGLAPDAKSVLFRCSDGYSVGVPLDRAMAPGSMLAYKMNDEYLPTEHGFPLRGIVPGIYGMMNAKWITEMEVIDNVYLGYWQQRGWSNEATIKTTSIIYYPAPQAQVTGTLPIAGVAFAGDRGIQKVEVSTDGGTTWNDAMVKKPRSQYSWVLWAYEWTPEKGDHKILVRATDGNGHLQDPRPSFSFPDGASGYHSIQVTAT